MPSPTLRESLEDTITKIETGNDPAPGTDDGSQASASPAQGASGDSGSFPAPVPNIQATSNTSGVASPAAPGAPAVVAQPGKEPGASAPAAKAPLVGPDGRPTPGVAPKPGDDITGPGTWSPEAREHWAKLPEQVRSAVRAREKDFGRLLNQSRGFRNFTEEFKETIKPFEGFIAAENATPMQAVRNMMQTAALFRVGTPQQKVEAVANIIEQFNIPLEQLDVFIGQRRGGGAATGGGAAPDFSAQVQAALQREMQPFREHMQSQRQQAVMTDRQLDQEVDQELSQFAQTHEFYEDLKMEMADLIQVARQRGVNLTLTAAYERATLLSEPVRQVLESRKVRTSATEAQRIADQARRGAVSVPSNSDVRQPIPQEGGSLRDVIENSIRQHEGG